MEHHRLDPYPIPKERTPLYVNEPWLADKTLLELPPEANELCEIIFQVSLISKLFLKKNKYFEHGTQENVCVEKEDLCYGSKTPKI